MASGTCLCPLSLSFHTCKAGTIIVPDRGRMEPHRWTTRWVQHHVAQITSGILTGNCAWMVQSCLVSPHTAWTRELQSQAFIPVPSLGMLMCFLASSLPGKVLFGDPLSSLCSDLFFFSLQLGLLGVGTWRWFGQLWLPWVE